MTKKITPHEIFSIYHKLVMYLQYRIYAVSTVYKNPVCCTAKMGCMNMYNKLDARMNFMIYGIIGEGGGRSEEVGGGDLVVECSPLVQLDPHLIDAEVVGRLAGAGGSLGPGQPPLQRVPRRLQLLSLDNITIATRSKAVWLPQQPGQTAPLEHSNQAKPLH